MEDIKAYMESGILELYVLGDVSPEEKLQVEDMVSKHPAVKAELEEIELAMEVYAAENAIKPADHLRERILNNVVTNLADDNIFPVAAPLIKDNVAHLKPAKPNNFYKYAFAACFALLIASIFVLMNTYNKLQDANTRLIAMNTQNQQFAKTVSFKDEQLSVFTDTSFKFIKLKGTANHSSASMVVAFSPLKEKVMIDMADLNLPDNDQAHQYQLWAIVDKKPVSLGVFDKSGSDTADMKPMQSIASTRTFAVTLEPRGGSINPTMDQMMVIGTF